MEQIILTGGAYTLKVQADRQSFPIAESKPHEQRIRSCWSGLASLSAPSGDLFFRLRTKCYDDTPPDALPSLEKELLPMRYVTERAIIRNPGKVVAALCKELETLVRAEEAKQTTFFALIEPPVLNGHPLVMTGDVYEAAHQMELFDEQIV